MQKKDTNSISHSYTDYSYAIKSEKYNTTVMHINAYQHVAKEENKII